MPESTSQVSPIKLDFTGRLESDDEFRKLYFWTFSSNEVATELRTMRLRRKLRQEDLAEQAGTGQSAISRIEKRDYDSWTFKTLLNIAAVLKARLRIRLEPLEDVVQAHRKHEENDLITASVIESEVETVAPTPYAELGGTEARLGKGDSTQMSWIM